MMRGIGIVLAFGLLVAGCVSVNEGNLVVHGQAVDAASVPYEACLLDTRDFKGVTFDRRRISGDFRESIVVGPVETDYSFAISCAGANETYQSPSFRFDPSEPIDVGRVILKRS
jgi:hypothetical protein